MSFNNNPITNKDILGNVGEVTTNANGHTTITMHIVFYGGAAAPNWEKATNDISKQWNSHPNDLTVVVTSEYIADEGKVASVMSLIL